MDSPAPHFTSSQMYNAFDAFSDAVSGWDLDFRQLDRGPFHAKLTNVITPRTILADCAFSRKIEQRGAAPPGYRSFGIPAKDGIDVTWRNHTAKSNQMMRFPQGGELDSVSGAHFHVFAFSVLESRLEEAAENRGLLSVDQLFSRKEIIHCPKKRQTKIRNLADELSDTAAIDPDAVSGRWFQNALESELVDLVLDAFAPENSSGQIRPMARQRSQALKTALDIISDRADEPVSVTEIERLSGVSGRTLRYAFEEKFGLSPKQYLQAYRLNRVRRELQKPPVPDSVKIADIANSWGYWHMGQFARDYRKMFGELPGTTRERC